jgi:hypothetical protein
VKKKFNLDESRYDEFSYLCYLDIDDLSVQNYAKFHMGTEQINFKNRLRLHLDFWKQLHTPEWVLDYIENGICIPFESKPPRMILQNTKAVNQPDMVPVIRQILNEYIEFGFIEKVESVPYCILPLQVKQTSDKTALIYDMSPLNEYVEKSKFKIES